MNDKETTLSGGQFPKKVKKSNLINLQLVSIEFQEQSIKLGDPIESRPKHLPK